MSQEKQGTNRRVFLSLAATTAALAIAPRGLSAQSNDIGSAKLAVDPMRPQFHLLPARNWMNDPNGPIYFNGSYHMFFQYNPKAAVWGDMSWNHAISKDMLHWTHLPVALTPDAQGPDSFGCFSGSAIQIENRVYVVYTGTKESTPELATIRDGQDKVQESQCLAWSDDPKLVRWTKAPQPVVPLPPTGMKVTGFRDPSVWKQDGWYYMTVGSGIAKTGGCVLLYRSQNMKDWVYLHELVSGVWNGKTTANPCDDGEMWECPEFFALDGGHVLIYSTLGKVFWQSGVFDRTAMKFKPAKTGLLDLDAFYAPKTQFDQQGRRILWGWIPERRIEAEMRASGWSGMMSLPRVMNLDKDGTLRLQTLPQISALRRGVIFAKKDADGVHMALPRASGEVICAGVKGESFEVTVRANAAELVRVVYAAEKHAWTAGGQEIALGAADVPTLHMFVDGSVIEMILAERVGYTKRFYYTDALAPDVQVSTSNSKVKMTAWEIAAISPDRLTTPTYGS